MKTLIDAAFSRGRMIVLVFVMTLAMGAFAYLGIPKESEPDIPIPTMYVSMTHEGISPEDAERLLIRPMEKELQAIEGLKEMRSTASEGRASVMLEFDAGFNAEQALQDVREKVDLAKPKLPPDTDDPQVTEVNVALFPVLTVVLSGAVPERTLIGIARETRDKIEALPGVLEVDIGGDREEVMEILIEPSILETYQISYAELFSLVQRNNRLVAAGAIDTGAGRMVLKVPGVIEDIEDVLTLPIKVVGDTVVAFKDVATVRRAFKDPEGYARVGGQSAVALEISKRSGANIIETIDAVRAIIESERLAWPPGLAVSYLQDKSKRVSDMLGDLQNNILTAITLVMIVVIAALGLRPAVLVGLAIPGSFLAGILILNGMGLTLNIVVLFGLILVVGMLVDGVIVTVELADRKMAEGLERRAAYAQAATRMAWPIIASTATTQVVFLPLLFWPGTVGEFMKYLPITVLVTLTASLFMALVFIPVLGGMIGGRHSGDPHSLAASQAAETGDLSRIGGLSGAYLRLLGALLRHPAKTFGVAVLCLVGAYAAYLAFGRGVQFFPSSEPDFAQVQVQARGDLSVQEKDAVVRKVEERLWGLDEIKTVYARTLGASASSNNRPEDVIGIIQIEFSHWRVRRPAAEIIPDLRARTADIPGIQLQIREQKTGPSGGKPVQIQIRSRDAEKLSGATRQLRMLLDKIGGFVDVEDSRPLPSIEWRLDVDRAKAARNGADVTLLGDTLKMLTAGIKLAEYRPDDADEEVDIRLRFPTNERNLEGLSQLRVSTAQGQIPISNFIRYQPAQKTGTITRTDGRRTMTIKADVAEGLLVDGQVRKIKAALPGAGIDPGVEVVFKGEDEDQRKAGRFLISAFILAVFFMTVILVTQFNSFYQAGLVLSAILFSTAGVLLGLLAMGQPFGIVMGGIGVIALAGIVVNNNIILIDTFNDLKKRGLASREAILRTAAQRMRPVLLTSITTVLGLLPMVFAINIDLIGQDIAIGAPSARWWTQLSSTIAGGLTFATILTLVLTPCLLMLGENVSAWRESRRRQRSPVAEVLG